ncbi:Serralysin [Ascidiaceihabitans donghaensis]|uniref:Serralysin n=1 Tax=Ascidiaceihabitans donghaensis TaxID=1510460 RepID=A0A2R8BD22_9RHOB|nr:Serralysin [Ascidiaceihabitans donghaensis]
MLCGNSGADTFIYEAVIVSTLAEAHRIRDFESNIDKIDMSALESFTFIGSNAFSGKNTGAKVRCQTTFPGLRFEMDVDGNDTVDMRVNMNGASTMTPDDFIL